MQPTAAGIVVSVADLAIANITRLVSRAYLEGQQKGHSLLLTEAWLVTRDGWRV